MLGYAIRGYEAEFEPSYGFEGDDMQERVLSDPLGPFSCSTLNV